jgi:hypothetical protein
MMLLVGQRDQPGRGRRTYPHAADKASAKRDLRRPQLRLLARQFFPRPAAAHTPWLLGHDVRTGSRVAITGFDQNPAALAGTGQSESPSELAAAQNDGQMVRLITDELSGALIPDNHRARTACLPCPDPLIVTRGQGVVLDRHGQPPDTGIERRPFGNRPRPQDLAGLDPKIEMQRRRVVKLHHKARHRHDPTLQPGPYTARTLRPAGAVARIIRTAALLRSQPHDEASEQRVLRNQRHIADFSHSRAARSFRTYKDGILICRDGVVRSNESARITGQSEHRRALPTWLRR